MITLDELLERWERKPIRNCPGRYVLPLSGQFISFERLLGGNFQIHSFACSTAKDTVLVFPLDEGGLISYAREDGSILHTLNTSEGFARKLAQLGLSLSTIRSC